MSLLIRLLTKEPYRTQTHAKIIIIINNRKAKLTEMATLITGAGYLTL